MLSLPDSASANPVLDETGPATPITFPASSTRLVGGSSPSTATSSA